MAVYLMQMDGGPIKIGRARNPEARRQQIQTGSPVPVCLIAVVQDGDRHFEAELHQRFSRHRISGEWFVAAPEIIEFAARHPWEPPTARYQRSVPKTALARYIAERGLTLEAFAKRVDLSTASVSRIVRGLQRPDWDTMMAISRETGGEVTPNDFIPQGEEAA